MRSRRNCRMSGASAPGGTQGENMEFPAHADYALGYSDGELQRLIRQSALYAELTETLLRSAGIGEGMRVLDVGCGAGCVSLLVAGLVGPAGAVVGVDRSPEAIALARRRADGAGLRNVEFLQDDLADLRCTHGF